MYYFYITIFIFTEKTVEIMMMLLRSEPNQHDFLHPENEFVGRFSWYSNSLSKLHKYQDYYQLH